MVKIAAAPSRAALRPRLTLARYAIRGRGPTSGIAVTGPSGPGLSIWPVRGPGRDDTIASRSHRLDTLPGGTGRRNGATDTVRTRLRTPLPGHAQALTAASGAGRSRLRTACAVRLTLYDGDLGRMVNFAQARRVQGRAGVTPK